MISRALAALASCAVAVGSTLLLGCGPAPGYEQEPRVPVAYTQQAPEPATAEELALRGEAGTSAAGAGDIDVGATADEYADTDPSALEEFKPALEGHGNWVEDPTYGTLWVPAESEVGSDFVPYSTAGHWTYSDTTNWVWVSDYSWGWAPFHYGRWVHVRRHGWAWIPGRTYSGAWVTWRVGPSGYDYIGWAPMGPDWYWYRGVAFGWSFGYVPYYSYCHRHYIHRPSMPTHVVRGPAAREMETRTQPYIPPTPQVVEKGRVAATPSVGGRTPAQPSVGERVSASPRVGPKPSDLGIPASSVVAPPSEHEGLTRARAFASPATAVAQGARAPTVQMRTRPLDDGQAAIAGAAGVGGAGGGGSAAVQARTSPSIPSSSRGTSSVLLGTDVHPGTSPGRGSSFSTQAPSGVAGTTPSSSFDTGARVGTSVPSSGYRSTAPSAAYEPPPQRGFSTMAPTPTPPSSFQSGSGMAGVPAERAPSATFPTPPSAYRPSPGVAGPTYRPSPSYAAPSYAAPSHAAPSQPSVAAPSSPTYRPSPRLSDSSSPSVGSPSPRLSSPTYRPSPSVTAPSSPTFRSSPSVSAPTSPTYRPAPSVAAPSSPTFRSTPSVAAPSSPSYRPSTPSVSAPSIRSSPSVSPARPSTPFRSSSPSVGVRRR